jgi:hypothetical protein
MNNALLSAHFRIADHTASEHRFGFECEKRAPRQKRPMPNRQESMPTS